jgi:hypothetical protein
VADQMSAVASGFEYRQDVFDLALETIVYPVAAPASTSTGVDPHRMALGQ